MKPIIILLLGLWLLPGCATHFGGSQPMLRTELYFGLSWPDGRRISDGQWQTFLDTCISPRFPAGLSVLPARGQWQMATGEKVQEHSRIVTILHPPAARARLDTVVAAYKTRFDQEAVLRVSTRARVGF